MKIENIDRDWIVAASEGTVAVGAVRRVLDASIIVYIEGLGDVEILPNQIASVHDIKVILDVASLDLRIQTVIEHAHDAETE